MKIKDITRESLVPIADGWVLMEAADGTTYKIRVRNFTPEGKFKKFTTSYQFGNIPPGTILDDKSALDAIQMAASRSFAQATAYINGFGLLEKGAANAITVSGGITLNDVQATQLSVRMLKKNGAAFASFSTLTFSYSDTITQSNTYLLVFDVNMADGSVVGVSASQEAKCVAPSWYGLSQDEFVLEAEAKAATKDLVDDSGSKPITFYANAQHQFFFEPASFGRRNRIMDQNGFNVTDAFEYVSRSFTLPNGQAEAYNGYIKKTAAGNGSGFTFTFHKS